MEEQVPVIALGKKAGEDPVEQPYPHE